MLVDWELIRKCPSVSAKLPALICTVGLHAFDYSGWVVILLRMLLWHMGGFSWCFTVLLKWGGEIEDWLHPSCVCMCAIFLRPLCSLAYNVKQDNRGSVSRHCVCVCVEGWETEWTRVGMTKLRPKGPFSNKLHCFCVLLYVAIHVFPDLNNTDW